MTIARAWYVMCDDCGNPTPITVESGKDARRIAAAEGYVRKRIDGRMCDLCPNCAASRPGRSQ